MKRSIALAASLVLAGCASITGDTTQSIRIQTTNAEGVEVKDADCELSNEYGSFRVRSPGNVMVRRSSTDLNIQCSKEQYAVASAKAVSRANGGMFGNIIFGGGIGAIIDHSKGTAYTYPQWMTLSFGKVLSFDRSDDKDGQPSLARDTGSVNQPKSDSGTTLAAPGTTAPNNSTATDTSAPATPSTASTAQQQNNQLAASAAAQAAAQAASQGATPEQIQAAANAAARAVAQVAQEKPAEPATR